MRYCSLLAILCLAAQPALALEAGVAVADITPDVSKYAVPMAGYGAREGKPATGVHDPLRAKVLFLRDGEVRMALIACDLRSSTPEFKQQIVAKSAKHGLTLDNVMVTGSHTHAGPAMYPEPFWQLQFGKYDPAVVEEMSTAVAKAVDEAVRGIQTVQAGFGEKELPEFTRNRRWGYDTEAREAANEQPAVDPRMWMLRLDTADRKPLALLVQYATHPTILGADNFEITAEWPGVLQRSLEQRFPESISLFINGTEGDQAPANAVGKDGWERIDDFGTRLANEAAELARTIDTEAALEIGYARGTPDLPSFAFTDVARETYGAYLEAATRDLPKQAEIQVFRIGSVALVGLPGEPIVEVGQAVRQALKPLSLEAIVVGLANDYIGYIVNEKEYAHGGYEVDSRSYYGPGLGDFMARHAAEIAGAAVRPESSK